MGLRDRMSAVARAFSIGGGNEGILAQMTSRTAMTGPRRGTREFLRLYSTSPWLRAVAHRIGSTVGEAMSTGRLYIAPGAKAKQVGRRLQRMSGPLRRLEIREMAKRDDLREITDHPLLDTLHRPNPAIKSGSALFKLTQIWLDLAGEGEWVMDRNQAGMPISYWPTPPHWVQQLPQPGSTNYFYSMPGWAGQVPATEVIRFFDADPENPYGRGSAMARALDDEIEIDEFTAKFMKGFFYNGARPDILMWGPAIEKLTPAQEKSLRLGWRSNLQGFWNAFKMHLLKVAELNVKEFTQPTLEQLQLSQLRDAQRDAVIHVFGFPKECFGITETSNRATIDAADYLMKLYSVTPRVGYLGEVIQQDVVPLYDDRLIWEVDSPVREDDEFQLKVAHESPWARTLDEWREKQGLAPLPNGRGANLVMVPFSLTATPIDELGAKKATPSQLPPMPDDAEGSGDADDAVDALEPAKGTKLRRRARAVPAQIRGYSVEELVALIHRIADAAAPAIHKLVLAALESRRDAVSLEQLAEALRTGQVQPVLDSLPLASLGDALAKMEPELRRAMLRAGATSAAVLAQQTGQEFEFDPDAPDVAGWLKRRLGDTVKSMLAGTAAMLRETVEWLVGSAAAGIAVAVGAKLLRELVALSPQQGLALRNLAGSAIDAGLAPAEIDTMLEVNGKLWREARATDTGAVEAMQAANEGRFQSWDQAHKQGILPSDAERTWLTTEEGNVCQICSSLNNDTVPLHERYYSEVTDQYYDRPGDPHPRCRCAEVVIL